MTDTVRVPREPTEAMLDAACHHGPDTPAGRFDYSDARTVWSAMLAASPQGEGSSAHPAPIKPSADTGELRERVTEIVSGLVNCFTDFTVAEREAFIGRKTDTILDLIQSERAG